MRMVMDVTGQTTSFLSSSSRPLISFWFCFRHHFLPSLYLLSLFFFTVLLLLLYPLFNVKDPWFDFSIYSVSLLLSSLSASSFHPSFQPSFQFLPEYQTGTTIKAVHQASKEWKGCITHMLQQLFSFPHLICITSDEEKIREIRREANKRKENREEKVSKGPTHHSIRRPFLDFLVHFFWFSIFNLSFHSLVFPREEWGSNVSLSLLFFISLSPLWYVIHGHC